MIPVTNIISYIQQHKWLKLLVIFGALIVALLILIPFALSFTPENIKKTEIKDKIVQKIGRSDFEVKEIVAESQGWYLAKIAFKDDGSDNTSLAILKQDNGKFVLKFGPGTSFNNELLDAVGVPDAVYSRQAEVPLDPIAEHLPYDTDFYTVRTSKPQEGKLDAHDEENGTNKAKTSTDTKRPTIGTPDNKKELIVYIYEFPRTGQKVTPQKMTQYKNEVNAWIQSLGLSTDNYTLSAAVWPYGNY